LGLLVFYKVNPYRWTFLKPKCRIPVPFLAYDAFPARLLKQLLDLGFVYDQKLPIFAKAMSKLDIKAQTVVFKDFRSFVECFEQIFSEIEMEGSLGLLASIAVPTPHDIPTSFLVSIQAYAPVPQITVLQPQEPVEVPVASSSLPSHPPTSRLFYSPMCENDPKFKVGDMVTPASGGVYKVVSVDTIEIVDVERRQSVSANVTYSYKILDVNGRIRASMAYSAAEESLSLWQDGGLSLRSKRGATSPAHSPTKRTRTSKPAPLPQPLHPTPQVTPTEPVPIALCELKDEVVWHEESYEDEDDE
jgi:hypothetical protein